jgi:hypothetical protein
VRSAKEWVLSQAPSSLTFRLDFILYHLHHRHTIDKSLIVTSPNRLNACEVNGITKRATHPACRWSFYEQLDAIAATEDDRRKADDKCEASKTTTPNDSKDHCESSC